MCSITEYTMYKICEAFDPQIGKSKSQVLSKWSFGATYAMRANLGDQTPAEFIDRMIKFGHLMDSGNGLLVLSESGQRMVNELRDRVKSSEFSGMEIYSSDKASVKDAPALEV
ncbi:MAG: hypothetical protein AB2799_19595 [Candidatus Thiodiazotropha sp.]